MTATHRTSLHRDTILTLRFELKRDGFITAEYRKAARKYLRDSRKYRAARKLRPAGADPRTPGKLGPTPQNMPHKGLNPALAAKLLDRCLWLRSEADGFGYGLRNQQAALAYLRGKPCPVNPHLLDPAFIAIWIKSAGLAPTEDAAKALASKWLADAKKAAVAA